MEKAFFKSKVIIFNFIAIIATVLLPIFTESSINGQNIFISKGLFALYMIVQLICLGASIYGRIIADNKITLK